MGEELQADILAQTQQALADFRLNLEKFALQHREAIRMDPEFRANFHRMCATIGVDPLASNKSSVNKWLDFKDWSFASFYYALGVSVVEVCMTTRQQNGGLIELQQLTELVQRRRGTTADKVSADDILQVRCKHLVVHRVFCMDSTLSESFFCALGGRPWLGNA
jgi:ESCRT-II complex subunit VPS22